MKSRHEERDREQEFSSSSRVEREKRGGSDGGWEAKGRADKGEGGRATSVGYIFEKPGEGDRGWIGRR